MRAREIAAVMLTVAALSAAVELASPPASVAGPNLHGALEPAGQGPADEAEPHADPPPDGVSLTAPTDTASLYRRAGLARGLSAAERRTARGTTAVPPGTPVVPGLGEHVEPSCTGTGSDGKRVQVLYAYQTGQAPRYAAMLPLMRHEIATVDDIFAVSSAKTGGGRRVRWVHDADCLPVITKVELPAGSLGSSFGATISALRAAGYTRADRKYVVFSEGSSLCGIATYYVDSRPTGNYNDGAAPTFARIDAACWSTRSVSTLAHELTHSLGGVLASAPNATLHGHCSDEADLMCYDDGSSIPMRQVCPSNQGTLLDCRDDDYFSTAPAPGTFLASSWNTASSGFLDTVAPLGRAPQVTLVASASAALTGETVTFTASSDAPATYAWTFTEALCIVGGTDTATLTIRCPGKAAGKHTVGVTVTALDGRTTRASRSIRMTKALTPTTWGPPGLTGATVHARLRTDDGEPVRSARVSVQHRASGTTRWRAVAVALTTGAAGGVGWDPERVAAGDYRFRFSGSTTHARATSASVYYAGPRQTRLRASVTGERRWLLAALLRDTTGQRLAGEPVRLQGRHSGLGWTKVGSGSTDADGVAVAEVRPGRFSSYRWVHPATPTTTRSVSGTVTLGP